MVYFDNMLGKRYLVELQLNKANTTNNEASFFQLALVHF